MSRPIVTDRGRLDGSAARSQRSELMLGLYDDLRQFDGKAVADLRAIKARVPASPAALDALIVLATDAEPNVQVGASWLIRAYLQDGDVLTAEQVGRLAAGLGHVQDGFARLHLCQAMEHLTVPAAHAVAFADFFRACRESQNTFLRAWAPTALFFLAAQHGRFEDEAIEWVREALSDPAASVRARARKTLEGA